MPCFPTAERVLSIGEVPEIRPGEEWSCTWDCPADVSSWDTASWIVTEHPDHPNAACLLCLTTEEGLVLVNEHAASRRHHGDLLLCPPHIAVTLMADATRQLPPAHKLFHQLTLHTARGLSVSLASGPLRVLDDV